MSNLFMSIIIGTVIGNIVGNVLFTSNTPKLNKKEIMNLISEASPDVKHKSAYWQEEQTKLLAKQKGQKPFKASKHKEA